MAWIEIDTLADDGRFKAWLSEPSGDPRGAIVVIQEIFGVNEGIRRKCDHWASLGYLALAPDLFWRLEPGIELDPEIDEEISDMLTEWIDRQVDAALKEHAGSLDAIYGLSTATT